LIGGAEQLKASGDVFLFGAIGQKAEVAHALKAAGKYVEQKAADEFVGIESHGPLFAGFPVPVEKGHLAIGEVDDPVVGDGNTVGIAAQVFEDGFRGGEGSFGVDVPVLGAELGVELAPAPGSGPDFSLSVELNLAAVAGLIEQVEKFGAENQAERLDVKQEIGFGRNPAGAIGGERAAGDQTMEMEVIAQSLVPGVKDGQEADRAVKMSPSEIGQGLRDRLEEDVEEDLLVDQDKGIQFVGNREHQMEMTGG